MMPDCQGGAREAGCEGNRWARGLAGIRPGSEEGATLVEWGLAGSLFLLLMFGFIQVSMALFASHVVNDAAREASRWAMVRGSHCKENLNAAYCSPVDLNPLGADNNDIQRYVRTLGLPYASGLSTSTVWLNASSSTPTTWTSCGGVQCSAPGNQVKVTVSYDFPLAIPFWRNARIHLSSTSTMQIAQ